eukprot:6255923-Karenia_brevis.AAC.1
MSKGVPGKGASGSKGAFPGVKGKGVPGVTKGLGKGITFQGNCWKYGVWGHRSFECPNASVIQGVQTESPQEAEVDT